MLLWQSGAGAAAQRRTATRDVATARAPPPPLPAAQPQTITAGARPDRCPFAGSVLRISRGARERLEQRARSVDNKQLATRSWRAQQKAAPPRAARSSSSNSATTRRATPLPPSRTPPFPHLGLAVGERGARHSSSHDDEIPHVREWAVKGGRRGCGKEGQNLVFGVGLACGNDALQHTVQRARKPKSIPRAPLPSPATIVNLSRDHSRSPRGTPRAAAAASGPLGLRLAPSGLLC